MGNTSFSPAAMLAQWKLPASFAILAILAIPAWQAGIARPSTAALTIKPAIFDLSQADSVIIYAAPVDADPVLRISSRDTDGNWQESELQLSNEQPAMSAKLLNAAVAREIALHHVKQQP